MIDYLENIISELREGILGLIALVVIFALLPSLQPVIAELNEIFCQFVWKLNTNLHFYLLSNL
jgi:hypothetical protein